MRMSLARARLAGARGLAALAFALAALAAIPAAGQASAIGYQYWSPFTWNGITFPGGQLTHAISGSGLHVKWDGANFASLGNVCDSSIRFTYGYGSYRLDGNVHRGCSHVGQWKYNLDNWKAPRGKACAELWAERWRKRITKQCHYIYP